MRYAEDGSGVERSRFRIPASRRPTRMIASPANAVFAAPYENRPARSTSAEGTPSMSVE